MTRRAKLRLVLVYTVYLLLAFALQSLWSQDTLFLGAKPNFLLLLAVLAGYQFGYNDAIVIGLLAGFLLDFASGRVIGVGMLSLMLAALIASRLFQKNFTRSILPAILTSALCTLFYELMVHLALAMNLLFNDLPLALINIDLLMTRSLASILINIIVLLPMFILLRFFGPYRRSYGAKRVDVDRRARR